MLPSRKCNSKKLSDPKKGKQLSRKPGIIMTAPCQRPRHEPRLHGRPHTKATNTALQTDWPGAASDDSIQMLRVHPLEKEKPLDLRRSVVRRLVQKRPPVIHILSAMNGPFTVAIPIVSRVHRQHPKTPRRRPDSHPCPYPSEHPRNAIPVRTDIRRHIRRRKLPIRKLWILRQRLQVNIHPAAAQYHAHDARHG